MKLTTVRLQVRSIRSQCKCNIRISKVIFPSFLKRIIQIKLLIFFLALTFWMVEAFISVWNDSGYYSFVLFKKKCHFLNSFSIVKYLNEFKNILIIIELLNAVFWLMYIFNNTLIIWKYRYIIFTFPEFWELIKRREMQCFDNRKLWMLKTNKNN